MVLGEAEISAEYCTLLPTNSKTIAMDDTSNYDFCGFCFGPGSSMGREDASFGAAQARRQICRER